jgi:hypothetical protein
MNCEGGPHGSDRMSMMSESESLNFNYLLGGHMYV